VTRADGKNVDVIMSAAPLFDDNGAPRGAIGAMIDISDRKRAEASQTLLLRELQHRVKNVLTTVSSLVSRMAKSGETLEEFSRSLKGRLAAMASIHELFSNGLWNGADLRMMAERILAPYAGRKTKTPNASFEGPELSLAPNAASTLGMALHELASNAAKYGALSVREGKVSVSWQLRGPARARRLVLSWIERDGPSVKTNRKDGFGTVFIRRSTEYELDGSVTLTFGRSGVRAVIEFPLGDNVVRRVKKDGNGNDSR
jgi:two-component system, chemotaxis family, CheB/CheR fusion protein